MSLFLRNLRTLIRIRTIFSSKTHQSFLQNPLSILRPISTTSSDTTIEHPKSLILSYLTNTLGFSSDAALKASKRLNFKTTDKADSVLACFRNHGFTDAHIARIINSCPPLIACNHAKVIDPKMDLLRRLGFSDSDLVKLICSNPGVLTGSLNNSFAPCIDSLKTIFGSDDNVVTAIKRTPWIMNTDPERKLRPNVQTLQALGVPVSRIAKSMRRALCYVSPDRFKEVTETVKGMGIDPMRPLYLLAVLVMSGMDEHAWERKLRVYRNFGFSEDEVLSMFKRQSRCMAHSAEKIERMLGFFVNELGWKPSVVSKCPNVLNFCVEERIVPRCSVLKLLELKDLLDKDLNWVSVLGMKEKDFLERFINKYLDEVPELMRMYRGKMSSN
ncbi:hypothetical protein QJS04_geneDACA024668 [Acorus gramineus]|uniref:Uncharacterized protein n=1 Tax=Acorus gramineus TaxID=55184 RepID=A0AAV9A0V1_ACOGR|nr:hypothetical protein QJS04_geneDACA024668 [Acorus gramineus]